MIGRISIRDLAKIAGVSRTTVSLALRDSHKISADVRKRVQDLAAENNYKSHPMVAALMQQIRVKRKVQDEEVIAFVTSDPTPDEWKTRSWVRELWEGASAEASRFGFRLECFWAGFGAKNSTALAHRLYHRGIKGVLFAPMPWPHPIFSMPWEKFVAVGCTTSTAIKDLPVVRINQVRGMISLLERLKELGAKSIGVAISEEDDSRIERAWSMGVHAFCLEERQIKTNLLKLSSYDAFGDFASWFNRLRPDVVVGTREEIIVFLGKLGFDPGTRISYASLNVATEELGNVGGFYQDASYLGRRAVQYISNAIYDMRLGLPEHAESILVQGKLVDGNSLEPLRTKSQRRTRSSARSPGLKGP